MINHELIAEIHAYKNMDLDSKLMCLLEELCEAKDEDNEPVYTYHDIALQVIEFMKIDKLPEKS